MFSATPNPIHFAAVTAARAQHVPNLTSDGVMQTQVRLWPLRERAVQALRGTGVAHIDHSPGSRSQQCESNDVHVHGAFDMADTTRKDGDQNQLEGAAKELGGKVRGTFGDITDNRSQHAEGKMDELKGKAQKNLGKAQNKLDDLDRRY
jgi:uncharacterized protein YjbJ (UPF0337 family)